VEEEAACRGTRVDGVRETDEVDPLRLEAAHEIDELLDAAPEPIELPDDERVAITEDVERSLESRTIGDPAAHGVVERLLAF
jgi:hypothetical protein